MVGEWFKLCLAYQSHFVQPVCVGGRLIGTLDHLADSYGGQINHPFYTGEM